MPLEADGAQGAAPALTVHGQGLLRDLCFIGAMSTDQVRRLRFPGSREATCRRRLMELRRLGLVASVDWRAGRQRATLWVPTPAGAAAVGCQAQGTWDLTQLQLTLANAEQRVQTTLAGRVDPAAAVPQRA